MAILCVFRMQNLLMYLLVGHSRYLAKCLLLEVYHFAALKAVKLNRANAIQILLKLLEY